MKNPFTKGQVVVLKSGGPEMTVTGILWPSGDVCVAWFNGGGNSEHDEFPEEAIALAKYSPAIPAIIPE